MRNEGAPNCIVCMNKGEVVMAVARGVPSPQIHGRLTGIRFRKGESPKSDAAAIAETIARCAPALPEFAMGQP